ncbi:MAG: hypothetical protein ABI286_04490 [Edaphobacter sp.]
MFEDAGKKKLFIVFDEDVGSLRELRFEAESPIFGIDLQSVSAGRYTRCHQKF